MVPTKLAISILILSGFIAVCKAVAVSPFCCDVTPTSACGWVNGGENWQFAPGTTSPDVTASNYSQFYPPLTTTYAWVQDKSGALSSTEVFTITSEADSFTFDYYFNVKDIPTSCYLKVVLNINALKTIELASITVPYNGWQSFVISCSDKSSSYCCGDTSSYPCSGTIEFDTNYDIRPNEGLAAVDNFGCVDVITTLPPPPPYTLPPPSPSDCCTFETNVCGITSPTYNWYWSFNYPPTAIVPPPPPYVYPNGINYLWAQDPGATILTWTQVIQYTDTYSLAFYISSPYASISVSFQEYGTLNEYVVDTLTYSTTTNWQHHTIYANTALSIFGHWPLQGQFILQAQTSLAYPFVVAIDDVDHNGACHGALPCCYFDDPFFCDFTPYNPTPPYIWQWSGNTIPTNSIPTPSPISDYIYFETQNYIGSEVTASLRSNLIGIDENVFFKGNFFSYTPYDHDGIQSLEVNFWESVSNTATNLLTVKDTYGVWEILPFQCKSPNGHCCQGKPTCTGYLEFSAFVQAAGGTVTYAIDAIETNDVCIPFPGIPSK